VRLSLDSSIANLGILGKLRVGYGCDMAFAEWYIINQSGTASNFPVFFVCFDIVLYPLLSSCAFAAV
jgi:hypothetical protein